MKDYKTLPFLRRAVNVIVPPDRVTSAAEAVRVDVWMVCVCGGGGLPLPSSLLHDTPQTPLTS